MRLKLSHTLLFTLGCGLLACEGADPATPATGGSQSTGGVSTLTGGTNATGGTSSTGGITATGGVSSGGVTSTGGVTTGGVTNTGGVTRTGGITNTGGTTRTGGVSTGGVTGNGGAATGGVSSTGGTSTGGVSTTGGTSSGGVTSTGGTRTGGVSATGGVAATGGTTTATGGTTGGGGITSTCTEADKSFTANATGKHCGYTYEYWKDSGTGTLVVKPDGFSVTWSSTVNLLGRKGVRPGNSNLVTTYEATYKPDNSSYLCVYGWTRNPLIEYYIVDSWGTWRPPGGQSLGTVTSDGGDYDIYKTQRVQQPSIDGTQTFWQYWSVRKTKKSTTTNVSGTITFANHAKAWADKGLNLGTFYEVSMTVEAYDGGGKASGTADVKMSIQ